MSLPSDRRPEPLWNQVRPYGRSSTTLLCLGSDTGLLPLSVVESPKAYTYVGHSCCDPSSSAALAGAGVVAAALSPPSPIAVNARPMMGRAEAGAEKGAAVKIMMMKKLIMVSACRSRRHDDDDLGVGEVEAAAAAEKLRAIASRRKIND